MTTTLTQITEPGVYDIPADVYHADPIPGGSLSSSGARKLLPPSCPALYRYERDNPPTPKRVFEIGHAAHKLVLGSGPELVRIDADEWRSNAVKAQVAEARDRGAVPLKPAEWDQVHAMAEAIRTHPIASALFQPGHGNTPGNHGGKAEQTLIWQDRQTGVWLRAMLDWLPYYTIAVTQGTRHSSRLIVPEYKTCRSAAPDTLDRTIEEHGYHIQAAWNLGGIQALHPGLAQAVWVWVWQEKTPPYLITVAQPTEIALRIGRDKAREAIGIYAQCVTTGQWPGYSDDGVELVGLPPWVENAYLREMQ